MRLADHEVAPCDTLLPNPHQDAGNLAGGGDMAEGAAAAASGGVDAGGGAGGGVRIWRRIWRRICVVSGVVPSEPCSLARTARWFTATPIRAASLGPPPGPPSAHLRPHTHALRDWVLRYPPSVAAPFAPPRASRTARAPRAHGARLGGHRFGGFATQPWTQTRIALLWHRGVVSLPSTPGPRASTRGRAPTRTSRLACNDSMAMGEAVTLGCGWTRPLSMAAAGRAPRTRTTPSGQTSRSVSFEWRSGS